MKKILIIISLLLVNIYVFAQAVVQPTTTPVEETKSNPLDTVALAIGTVAVSALICYLVYLSITRSKKLKKQNENI